MVIKLMNAQSVLLAYDDILPSLQSNKTAYIPTNSDNHVAADNHVYCSFFWIIYFISHRFVANIMIFNRLIKIDIMVS